METPSCQGWEIQLDLIVLHGHSDLMGLHSLSLTCMNGFNLTDFTFFPQKITSFLVFKGIDLLIRLTSYLSVIDTCSTTDIRKPSTL